jgi:hypothetical protein
MSLLNVRVLTAANSTQAVTDSLTVSALAPFIVTTSSRPTTLPVVTTAIQGSADISVTTASPAVVGTLTTFTTDLVGGSLVQFTSQPGITYTVLTVVSDTSLTLTTNYTGVTNPATSLLFQYVNIPTGIPTATQFLVNYLTGVLTFNAAAASEVVSVNYNATFYTPTIGTSSATVELWGGGGAGGNAQGANPLNYSVGSGGGAGGYARYTIPVVAGPYQISIGTGGGTPVIGATFNGGNTVFTDGATVVTAYGGTQGNTIQVGASVPEIALGGLGGVTSTNGTYNSNGNAGREGIILSGNYILGGAGGSTSLSGAGNALGITGTGSGNNATPNTGSGGGGAISTNTTGIAFGGWGSTGVMVISEYDLTLTPSVLGQVMSSIVIDNAGDIVTADGEVVYI